MRGEDVTSDPAGDYTRNLNRAGGKPGRRVRSTLRVLCPVCSAGPMRATALTHHLRGKTCLRQHSADEARELLKRAPRDPAPFNDAVRQIEGFIREWEGRISGAEDELARKNSEATMLVLRSQLARLLRLGIEGYTPPEGYYDEAQSER